LSNNNLPNIAYPPVENISNHSATKVSQEEKACQPKVNDTNYNHYLVKPYKLLT
jgi:hypothetical protein